MAQGIVKWFNNAKGYGFVCVDGVDEDVFVHHSIIEMQGYRRLSAGEPVLVHLGKSLKGLFAQRVVPTNTLSIEELEKLRELFKDENDFTQLVTSKVA